jgi:hypothetical protein
VTHKVISVFSNQIVLFFPSDLLKSYIHGHYRLNTKTCKRVWIESYQDKRPERNRAEFANWQHRIEHVKTHLAYGQHREAVHAFHDLNHADSKKLADDLGLTQHDEKHEDKKKLMEAVHARLAAKQKELSDKVVEQRRADLAKRRAAAEKKAKEKTEPAKTDHEPAKGNPKPEPQKNQWGMIATPSDMSGHEAAIRYKEILDERAAAAKFSAADVIAQGIMFKGAQTYKGYAVIRDAKEASNDPSSPLIPASTWRVFHPGTGLNLVSKIKTLKDAKLAAVRMGDILDGSGLATADEFSARAKEISRMKAVYQEMTRSWHEVDVYGGPEVDTDFVEAGQSQSDLPHGVMQQLKTLEYFGPKKYKMARTAHGNDADYRGAVRAILEGKSPIKIPTPDEKNKFNVEGIDNIVAKPIPVKKPIANTPAQKMSQLMVAAGNKDVRFYLNGVHIDASKGRIEATDGNRLSIYTDQAVAGELSKAFEGQDGGGSKLMVVDSNGQRIKGVGGYPDFDRVINHAGPASETVQAVNAADLLAAANGASAAGKYFNKYGISAVPVKFGKKIAGFNARYLADMAGQFASMGYPTFKVSLHGDGPMLIATSPDGKLTHAIMPMRVDPADSIFAPIQL